MGTLLALFGWTLAGWILFLVALVVGIGIALLAWGMSSKNKVDVVVSIIIVVILGLLGVWLAGTNASQHTLPLSDQSVPPAGVESVEQAWQDLSWIQERGFEIVELSLDENGEGYVVLTRDNCELGIGLRFWKGEYFLVVSRSSRMVSPELFETLFQQVCLSRQPAG